MRPHVRRAIVYIVANIISRKKSSAIYDYASSQYFNFSIKLSESGIAAYDFTDGSHVSGSYSSLFHYGESCYISIRINGNRFTGFDYGESYHFSGSVNGNTVSLYDYGVGFYFNFSI